MHGNVKHLQGRKQLLKTVCELNGCCGIGEEDSRTDDHGNYSDHDESRVIKSARVDINKVPREQKLICFTASPENVEYRGKSYTVIYDKSGEKYGCGSGLRIIEA